MSPFNRRIPRFYSRHGHRRIRCQSPRAVRTSCVRASVARMYIRTIFIAYTSTRHEKTVDNDSCVAITINRTRLLRNQRETYWEKFPNRQTLLTFCRIIASNPFRLETKTMFGTHSILDVPWHFHPCDPSSTSSSSVSPFTVSQSTKKTCVFRESSSSAAASMSSDHSRRNDTDATNRSWLSWDARVYAEHARTREHRETRSGRNCSERSHRSAATDWLSRRRGGGGGERRREPRAAMRRRRSSS